MLAGIADNTGFIKPEAGTVALNQQVCRSQGTKAECMLDAEISAAN